MGLFKKKYKPVFLNTKSVFTITLIVTVLTIIIIWLQGLHLERSVLRNSFLSTLILSGFLFTFMSIGLYRGYKLKDNLGKITDSFKINTDMIDGSWGSTDSIDLDIGDGFGDIIGSVIAWILVTIALGTLLFIFSNLIGFSILFLLAILYWIFFRALRLVFKKSPICQGHFLLSLRYVFMYTCFSTLWVSLILFVAEHQNNSLTVLGALFK